MFVTVILAILTVFLIIFVLRKRAKYPPGPFPWPIFGNRYYLEKLTRKFGGQYLAFLELSKIYNSNIISLRLGTDDVIVVTNSKLVHEVCFSEIYDGRPWNEFTKLRNMGMKKGITLNDGAEWKELRSWSMRTLRSVGFAKQTMMELIVEEMTLIIEKLATGGVQQIQSAFAPAVINVLWMLITGQKPSENLPRLQKFLNLMERRAEKFDLTGGILTAFPWLRYIAPEMSGYNFLVKLNNELKNFLMDTINEHKEQYIKGNETDFIDLFLKEMYNNVKEQRDKVSVFSDDNLLITLLDFFIAGISTTTATLDNLFLQMANHQDVQRKLYEEINDVIGSHKLPKLEDRIKMPFTEAIITECQRLFHVTPVIGPRRVLKDTILDNYKIPKNTTVLMNVYSNNLDPNFFPDPTSFKPERHINENGVYQQHENIILFGKGKRRCPGEALAKSATFLFFVGIMQKFQLLPEPGKGFIQTELKSGLILAPKPYKMLIVPR
ncbi:PREDICTED: probable cytochrome P450 305a1 [Atta colombica]|uniref:probable cytochrome P450 305a1 n=1 Tax=Atta colombica TaxID=520822 RepID=UPI00084BD2C9|nr:PREDICTED: probable cytochrome P450 305a1 [Atta colombica]